jgi:hypothetical protein
MLRNIPLPRIWNFTVRFALLLFYIQWLSEMTAAQFNDDDNTLFNFNPLASTTWMRMQNFQGSYVVESNATKIKNKLRELLVFHTAYREDTANKDYFTEILFEMHQSNPLDHCKLEFLLSYNPGFYFITSDQPDANLTHPSNGGYSESFNILYVFDFNINYNANFYRQLFSHELRHAIETLNNFKNGFCMHNGYPLPYIHGSNLPGSCETDSDYAVRVSKLIKKDFKRVLRLFEATTLLASQQTPKQHAELTQLGQLLKRYNYQPTFYTDADIPDPYRVLSTYSYNSTTHTYQITPDNVAPYKFQVKLDRNKTYVLDNYVVAYNARLKQGSWTFAKPFDTSEINLTRDLLCNILYRMNYLNLYYTEFEKTYETAAYLDEVLSPYSRPVIFEGNLTSLRGWLFPRLSNHEKTHYSKEFKTCLDSKEQALPEPNTAPTYTR